MRRLLHWFDESFEDTLEIGLLAFLLGNVLLEVFRRYALNASNQYAEEIARFTLVAMVYLGVPYAIKARRHIICDVLPSSTSQSVHFVVKIVSSLLFMFMCAAMTVSCWELVEQQMLIGKKTQAMYVPMWYFTSVVGIGFFLAFFRLVQALWQDIREYRATGIAHVMTIQE